MGNAKSKPGSRRNIRHQPGFSSSEPDLEAGLSSYHAGSTDNGDDGEHTPATATIDRKGLTPSDSKGTRSDKQNKRKPSVSAQSPAKDGTGDPIFTKTNNSLLPATPGPGSSPAVQATSDPASLAPSGTPASFRRRRRNAPGDGAGGVTRQQRRSGRSAGTSAQHSHDLGGDGEEGSSRPQHHGSPSQSPKITPEIGKMARYFGMDVLADKDLLWIAAEALDAKLPRGWSEHKADSGAVYFHNAATGKSSWEHPNDTYYKFLLGKLRKMKMAGKRVDGRNGKDRKLVDMLWAMEQDKDGASSLVSGTSSMTGTSAVSQSTASKLTISSFCSSGVEMLDDRRQLPEQVKDVATYLGISAEALRQPVTPAEVIDMANYLGVNVVTESYILPLVRMSLFAPLPKNWEIYKDDGGEPFYYNRVSKQTTYRHPADDYFLRKIAEERRKQEMRGGENGHNNEEPWMEFHDENKQVYWFNFETNERSNRPPPGGGVGGSSMRASAMANRPVA